MRKTSFVGALAAVLIAVPKLLLSAPLAAQQKAAPSTPVSVQAPPAPVDSSVIAVLRAQLAAEKEHNQAVLSTVYWSLGVTGGIFVLLLGFGWFVNFRVYDRDKQLLSDQLKRDTQEQVAAALSLLKEAIAAERAGISERIERLRPDLIAYLDKALEARGRVAEGRFDTLVKRQRDMQFDLSLLTARVQVRQRQFGNAFSNYIVAATIAGEREVGSQVNAILSELETTIERAGELFPSDVEKLASFVLSLRVADSVITERLLRRLSSAPNAMARLSPDAP